MPKSYKNIKNSGNFLCFLLFLLWIRQNCNTKIQSWISWKEIIFRQTFIWNSSFPNAIVFALKCHKIISFLQKLTNLTQKTPISTDIVREN
ncbi:Hypothetical protein MAGa6710 [Mycoplasmopsis agalactiae]|uniref:Uncharacterized protein n=1 Tax=Mycoplasmopsis agalactiae TaxID=2110 RepID=D3VRC7_MYCAA|nr:Hypothetical protein MAGa6710 [Mycoplasmopsis agalactiae]